MSCCSDISWVVEKHSENLYNLVFMLRKLYVSTYSTKKNLQMDGQHLLENDASKYNGRNSNNSQCVKYVITL